MADHHEVVINVRFGGFGISREAEDAYISKTGSNVEDLELYLERRRDDPVFVQIVKELGNRADDEHSRLKIVRIPAQYARFYQIDEYDGLESIRINYAAYQVQSAKTILLNASLTSTERVSRALAILCADLSSMPKHTHGSF